MTTIFSREYQSINASFGQTFQELFGGGSIVFFALACALSYLLSGRFSLYSSQKLVDAKLEPRYIDASAR